MAFLRPPDSPRRLNSYYKVIKIPAQMAHIDQKVIRSDGDLSRNGDAAGKYLEANPYIHDSKKGTWHNYSIVGYSMGGLVARSMLDGYASDYSHWGLRNHANGILTLDTPHEGADAADLAYDAERPSYVRRTRRSGPMRRLWPRATAGGGITTRLFCR